MQTDPSEGRSIRIFVLLFLAFNFFYLLTLSGRTRVMDEVTLSFEVESMAKHGSTAIPQAVPLPLFTASWTVLVVPRDLAAPATPCW